MISMRSSARSALKLRDNRVKREQNPRHGHYNGLNPAADAFSWSPVAAQKERTSDFFDCAGRST
jgi:hypothetical protein